MASRFQIWRQLRKGDNLRSDIGLRPCRLIPLCIAFTLRHICPDFFILFIDFIVIVVVIVVIAAVPKGRYSVDCAAQVSCEDLRPHKVPHSRRSCVPPPPAALADLQRAAGEWDKLVAETGHHFKPAIPLLGPGLAGATKFTNFSWAGYRPLVARDLDLARVTASCVAALEALCDDPDKHKHKGHGCSKCLAENSEALAQAGCDARALRLWCEGYEGN